MAPSPDKQVTRSELNLLFAEGDWQNRLSRCRRIPHYDKPRPGGGSTVLYEYWEGTEYIALVCYHRRPDGSFSEPHPKLLLIDGIWHWY